MPAPRGLVQWQILSLCLPLKCPRYPDCPCRKRRPDCRLPIETLLYLHKGEKEPPRTLIHFYEKRGNWGGGGGGKGGNPPHTFRRGLLGPYVRHQIVPSWLSWFTAACALEPRSNCNPAVLTTIFFPLPRYLRCANTVDPEARPFCCNLLRIFDPTPSAPFLRTV